MLKRTIELSRQPAHLCTQHEQLLILLKDQDKSDAPISHRIPFEDIGLLLLDERDTTLTHSVLVKLAENDAALVVCGRDHLPTGLYLPLSSNTQILHRLDAQLSASKPTKKRLWAQIVAAKIRAQGANLQLPARGKLLAIARRVRSGDPDNSEAHAAQVYWPALFAGLLDVQHPFRRCPGDRSAPPPNNLLDYAYAVLRASIARALIIAGLLPALGIKHAHRANAFALADDLIEPLRPLADARVRSLAADRRLALDQPTKAELLLLLTSSAVAAETEGPLQVVLSRYVASFLNCLTGESDRLAIPRPSLGVKPDGPEDDDP